MDANDIKLAFNEHEYLKVTLSDPNLKTFLPTDYADIIYYEDNKPKYLLHHFWIENALEKINSLLQAALSGNLHLDQSIEKDIGYIWNEKIQGRIEVLKDTSKENCPWVGMRHMFIAPPEGPIAWLYNNNEGEIIFEITPSYLWHFRDPEKNENFIDYDKFIHDYKPFVIAKINRATAKEWLKTTQELTNLMYTNERRWLKEAKAS